jgi:hypothetical protein
MVANGEQGFSGYDVSGDNLVWSLTSPEPSNKVFLYHISDKTTHPISSQQGYNPKINGNLIAWEVPTRAIQIYRLDQGITSATLENYHPRLVGIIGPDKLVFSSNGYGGVGTSGELYLKSIP